MLDIAWTEILIIAVVAILVVGPRELPRMLRGIGNFMGQMRRMAGDFQRQFNDALRESELDEVKRGFDSVRRANPLNKMKDDLNPLKEAGDSVRKAVEDPGAPTPSPSGEPGDRKSAEAAAAEAPVAPDNEGRSGSEAQESTASTANAASANAGGRHAGKAERPRSAGMKKSKTTEANKAGTGPDASE